MDCEALEVDQLRRAAEAGEILKDSALRRVWRANVAGEQVVLKEARVRGIFERVRALWMRSRVRVEDRRLREARSRGLPCPRPLGSVVARGLSPRSGWLLLEDLGRGRAVDEVLHNANSEERLDLLARCGKLIARSLEAGLVHRDLHLGNLWLRDDGELFLLDLHAAHFGHAARAPKPHELRKLHFSLPWPQQRNERQSLFRPIQGETYDDVAAHDLSAFLQHIDKRVRRALRPSGAFRRIPENLPAQWALLRRAPRFGGWNANFLRAAIANGDVLKSGRRGAVVAAEVDDVRLVAKSRCEARAMQMWTSAEALALRELRHAPAIANIAAGDSAAGDSAAGDSASGDSAAGNSARWIVSEYIAGFDLAEDHAAAAAPFARRLAVDLGRFFGRLHGTGMRCRDARLDNFVVGEDWRLHLVDLDGVAPLTRLSRWRRTWTEAADLARAAAWLRHQAPAWLRARAAELEALGFAAWRRERGRCMLYRGRSAASEDPEDFASGVAKAIEIRCEKWQSRHRQSRDSTTSDRGAAGSASGDVP